MLDPKEQKLVRGEGTEQVLPAVARAHFILMAAVAAVEDLYTPVLATLMTQALEGLAPNQYLKLVTHTFIHSYTTGL